MEEKTKPNANIALVDIAAAADQLGVTVRHIRRLVAERRIPFVKWGHLIRFDPVEISKWIDGFRIEPATPHAVRMSLRPGIVATDRRTTRTK